MSLDSDGEWLQITLEAVTPISEMLPPGAEFIYHVHFNIEQGWWIVLKGTEAGWDIWAHDGQNTIDVPNAARRVVVPTRILLAEHDRCTQRGG